MIALICLINAINVVAQNVVTGTVSDPKGQPLAGISVGIPGSGSLTTTDDAGRYTLNISRSGNVTLRALSFEYEFRPVQVKLGQNEQKTVNFKALRSKTNLHEVTVTGKTPVQQVRETPYNVTAIDATKLYNFTADINQVLNKTTGIKIRERGGMGSDFSFSLNGFSGKQVKYFLDGVPIDNYGSSFTLNNLPINLAERIEVYKGVVPVELASDALGGAINIVTNQHTRQYVDASYSIGSFNTHRLSLNVHRTWNNGFVMNVNAFGNYSDNSYSVDVSIADKETGKFLPTRKYKHFHDGYKSASLMLEAGVQKKSWADYMLFGVLLTGNRKEIQQGSTMQYVAGQAFTTSKGFIPSFKYKKDNLFTPGLTLSLSATFNKMYSNSVDTCSRVYDWTGGYTYRKYTSDTDAGELGDKTYYVYHETTWTGIASLKYRLNEHHSFTFNLNTLGYRRTEKDEYKTIDLPGTPTLHKTILGLSYNLNTQRLKGSVFGKLYSLRTRLSKDTIMLSSSFTKAGYGTAWAYNLTKDLQLKASYEYASRLPTPDEMLGDGLNVKANTGLKPESSHNVNVGVAWTGLFSKHTLGVELNFIYRRAENLIKSVPAGLISQYENQQKLRITGLDGTLRYMFADWLTFEGNATWQKSINIDKYDERGVENYLYGAQLPNVPIFYANADLGFIRRGLLNKKDCFQASIGTGYVGSFYLYWPSLGAKEYKKSIPEQFTQNLSLSYSLDDGRYNIVAECNNLTDKIVYDYFKVQKPGRSFSLKFRYFFHK